MFLFLVFIFLAFLDLKSSKRPKSSFIYLKNRNNDWKYIIILVILLYLLNVCSKEKHEVHQWWR